MRESIVKSVKNTVQDLHRSGLVDDITMKNIENLCLPEVQDFPLKKLFPFVRSSGSAKQLLPVFLISVHQRYRSRSKAIKKPAGASKKLLDIMERKGLDALV